MKLYRFGSLSERLVTYLADRRLFFQSPVRFNDPFDCDLGCLMLGADPGFSDKYQHYLDLLRARLRHVRFKIIQIEARVTDQLSDGTTPDYWYDTEMDLYSRERDALITELRHLEGVPRTAQEGALRESWETKKRSVLESLGIVCFAETNSQLLLWAHYADAHRGLCLEYDSEIRPVQGWKNFRFFPVEYTQHRQLDILKLGWDEAFFALVTKKSLEWAYENEHRLITIRGSGFQQGTAGSVTGIIFGMRVHENNPQTRSRLFETLLQVDETRRSLRKLRYFRAEKDPRDFAVRVLPMKGLHDVRLMLGL